MEHLTSVVYLLISGRVALIAGLELIATPVALRVLVPLAATGVSFTPGRLWAEQDRRSVDGPRLGDVKGRTFPRMI